MDIFARHEQFEIEVLDKMSRAGFLTPLVFGGGTMLRLCHDLNRYSADLDFWLLKSIREDEYCDKIQALLKKDYEITDAQIKHYTFLVELRSANYPRRLVIEIRKEIQAWDYQEKIAYSKFTDRQVFVKAHTLDQTMKNKVVAFLDRREIRDCFDIEFLLRRGIALPALDASSVRRFQSSLNRFKATDFKVKLGSILESDARDYYIANGFQYLKEKLYAVAGPSPPAFPSKRMPKP